MHTILLSKEMEGEKYHNILISGIESQDEGSMTYLAEQHGIEPVVLEGMGREISLVDDLRTLWRLYKYFRAERPDIVETHTAKAGTVGRIAALMAGVPTRIHFFHGHVLFGYFGRFKSWTFKMIEKILACSTHRIIACSEKVRQDLILFNVAPPEKIVTIPYGFYLDKFQQAAQSPGTIRKELGIATETKLVGIVARLVPIKGHHVFLDAAKKLVENEPDLDVKFLIVGDGELREQVQKQVEALDLQEKVILLSWRQDVEKAYADLDLLALTSFNEGLPLVIIEAMAARKPVVATNVGGVPEMVIDGETGFVVPIGDSDGLGEKMAVVLKNPDLMEAMGKKAQELSLSRYGIQRLVSDLDSLYQSLLED